MVSFPAINRRSLWSPIILILLALAVTIFSDFIIVSRLFINKSKKIPPIVPPPKETPFNIGRQNSDGIIPKQPELSSTSVPQRHAFFQTLSLKKAVGKTTITGTVFRTFTKTKKTTAIFSNQTLPASLRSALLPSGTKEEAVARKLMGIRRHKIVNPHDYEYRINPYNTCKNKAIEVVLCVVSAVHDFHLRHQFRYAVKGGYAGIWNEMNKATLVFFLGMPSGGNAQKLQRQVDNESLVHGDIVQATYIDTYKNLSIKTVSILKWVSTYCSNANFVIKTDDDCDVNIPLMITELHRKQEEVPLFMLGKVSKDLRPIRILKSKWYIPLSLYKEDKYPTFMFGGSQGYPTVVAQLLYEASLRIPLFYLEDVYISGLCAAMLNIPRYDNTAFYFSHFPPPGEKEY